MSKPRRMGAYVAFLGGPGRFEPRYGAKRFDWSMHATGNDASKLLDQIAPRVGTGMTGVVIALGEGGTVYEKTHSFYPDGLTLRELVRVTNGGVVGSIGPSLANPSMTFDVATDGGLQGRCNPGPVQPSLWEERWRASLGNLPSPENMTPEQIQDELNALLFDDAIKAHYGAKDPELLSIAIMQSKAGFFDFLMAGTKWPVQGRWHEYRDDNYLIEVQFMDNDGEGIGNRVMHLLYEYNRKVVGEELLYARVTPIEESTLEMSTFRGVQEKPMRSNPRGSASSQVPSVQVIIKQLPWLDKLMYLDAKTAANIAHLAMKWAATGDADAEEMLEPYFQDRVRPYDRAMHSDLFSSGRFLGRSFVALRIMDRALETHGVEYVGSGLQGFGFEHLNVGDMYSPTIVLDLLTGRWVVGLSEMDYREKYPKRFGRTPKGPMRNNPSMTYGLLPTKARFVKAFNQVTSDGLYQLWLKGSDLEAAIDAFGSFMPRAGEDTPGLYQVVSGRIVYLTENELWTAVKMLKKAFDRGNDDAGNLASAILGTLGFEWV